MRTTRTLILVALFSGLAVGVLAASEEPDDLDPAQVERGRRALLEQSHLGPMWGVEAYEKLWQLWADERPEDYAAAVRRRYGLHESPYDNDGYPMGIRLAERSGSRGLAIDCLLCHGGSIAGKTYVGLGNTTLDLESLLHDLTAANGRFAIAPGFAYNTTRGTTNSGAISERLIALRNPDLSNRLLPRFLADAPGADADAPAWWLLHRKQTMYADGSVDVRSVRSNMQFLMGKNSGAGIRAAEPAFAEIRSYLLSLRPPPYPFAVDAELAQSGRGIFEQRCAKCHGQYGPRPGGKYPNRMVPLETIGTDALRLTSVSSWFRAYFNETWFARNWPMNENPIGYQAPPLDGIWASAPYLHNGSVPTVYAVLNPDARPKYFRRKEGTTVEAYDEAHLGWKVTVLPEGRSAVSERHSSPKTGENQSKDQDASRETERQTANRLLDERKVYDTTLPGKSNQGHPFGIPLSDRERMAVIEYLKTF